MGASCASLGLVSARVPAIITSVLGDEATLNSNLISPGDKDLSKQYLSRKTRARGGRKTPTQTEELARHNSHAHKWGMVPTLGERSSLVHTADLHQLTGH